MVLRQVHQGPNSIVYPHWNTHTATPLPLHSDSMLHYTVGIEANQVWWYSRSCGPEQLLSGTGSSKHPGVLCIQERVAGPTLRRELVRLSPRDNTLLR